MSSTTTPPETEAQKIETDVKMDAEAVLKDVEEFFAHLFKHTHETQHPVLKAAQASINLSVLTPIIGAPAEPTPESAPVGATGTAA